MSRWLVVLVCVTSCASALDESSIHNEDFVQLVNESQDSWRARINFVPGSFIKNLVSVLPMRNERLPMQKLDVSKNIPKSFDGRKVWKNCKSLREVTEQGNCASAWALVAGSIFTDRLCVAKVRNVEISTQQILSCCTGCGVNCFGGYVTEALKFLTKKGSPSVKCQPYTVRKCPSKGLINCPSMRAASPLCWNRCRHHNYQWSAKAPIRASRAYSLANSSEVIMSEIMSRGPVAALLDLYEDFFVYKSGVYFHCAGNLVAHHPVKIVGWGEQDGRPFWLVLNSWGSMWGTDGIVKIARETNGCNLENRVFAIATKESKN